MTRSSAPPDDIREIARTLCAEPVQSISEIRRGANSRIFRVDTKGGRYALKKYPATDTRNRLEAEVSAKVGDKPYVGKFKEKRSDGKGEI